MRICAEWRSKRRNQALKVHVLRLFLAETRFLHLIQELVFGDDLITKMMLCKPWEESSLLVRNQEGLCVWIQIWPEIT